MEQIKDSYLTVAADAEAIFKEKSSKFLCYAYHVESEEEIAARLEPLRKRYYDAFDAFYRDDDAGAMIDLIAEYVDERLDEYLEILAD